MSHDIVLWIHVATGCLAWIVGAAALWTNLPGRRSHGCPRRLSLVCACHGCISECAGGLCAGAILVAVAASDLLLRSGPARLPGATGPIAGLATARHSWPGRRLHCRGNGHIRRLCR